MDKVLSNIEGKIKTAKLLRDKNIQDQATHQSEAGHDRLPPGQRLLSDPLSFPVLDLGTRPEFNQETYRFQVSGLVEKPLDLGWNEVLTTFPKSALTADFHCVTKWTQYDITWAGIKYLDLEKLVGVKPEAKFLIQYGLDGYSTNVPLADVRKENVLLAYELKDKPLPQEHGWPLRMIIPELYAWKGSKFLNKLEFRAEDESGFWEVRGYNNHGDPWKEERYS
jgi:DMSO/TMAO reductase YedYZ molybdopterin-dependent catalytic subunit